MRNSERFVAIGHHRPEATVSTRRFQRSCRLSDTQEFKRIFSNPERFDGGSFLVLAKANELHSARLGLAISKRCCPRAVDRNKLKRIARESFRAHIDTLPALDIVVLCTGKIKQLSNRHLFAGLDHAWKKILDKAWAES